MVETTSDDGQRPTRDPPDDPDDRLSQRREEILDRIEELHLREQQLVDRRTGEWTPGSLGEAEVHAAEAKAHAEDGHRHAAEAHKRASRRHTEAAELHERVADAFDLHGRRGRARAHREAAAQDREAAEAERQAAENESCRQPRSISSQNGGVAWRAVLVAPRERRT